MRRITALLERKSFVRCDFPGPWLALCLSLIPKVQAVIPNFTMHAPDGACKNHLTDFDLDSIFSFWKPRNYVGRQTVFLLRYEVISSCTNLETVLGRHISLALPLLSFSFSFSGQEGFDYITLALTITFGGRSTLHISTCVHIRRKGEAQETRTWTGEGDLLHIFLY